MAAVNYNFDIEKGSDFSIGFLYNNSDGTPVDLSDKCIILSLSGSDGSIRRYSSRALSNYDTNGWSLTANNSGAIEWKASASETSLLNFTNAVYDLDVKEIGTIKLNNIRIAEGTINILNRNISTSDIDCPSLLDPLVGTPIPVTTGSTNPTTVTPTPTGSGPTIADFCLPYDYGVLDLFSTVYDGSSLILNDLSITTGSVVVSNTGIIENVELAVCKLTHESPTDLIMLLSPPSGDKILLSANSKISKSISSNNTYSFMFSNKANSDVGLHNITDTRICNIIDKRNNINYNNEILYSSFDHLFGVSLTGVWNFIVKDTDPSGTGSIDSWRLIITYNNNIPENILPFECGIE